MTLVTVLTRDLTVRLGIGGAIAGTDALAAAGSWDRLNWLVRERPATVVVVDSGALPKRLTHYEALGELRRRFPSLSMLFIVRPGRTRPLCSGLAGPACGAWF